MITSEHCTRALQATVLRLHQGTLRALVYLSYLPSLGIGDRIAYEGNLVLIFSQYIHIVCGAFNNSLL